MKLSACILAKNEAANIQKCIESFRQFVSEVIVVDTGSTDETISIAQKAGAKVLQYQWENDFAKARNFAIQHAVGDWIVFLDADEYFVNDSAANLPSLVNGLHTNKKIDAIFCQMMHVDRHIGDVLGQDIVARIFRNKKQIRYKGQIHESLGKRNEQLQAFIADKKVLLLHHVGYSRDKVEEKAQRNLALLQENHNKGYEDNLYYYYLADCYTNLKQHEQVIYYTDLFLEKKIEVLGFACKPYVRKIGAMFNLRSRYSLDDILEVINVALEKFPDFPEFHRFLGEYYLAKGQYSLALQKLLETIEYNDRYQGVNGNDVLIMLPRIFYNIACLYQMKNDNVSALEYYIKSLRFNRFYEAAFRALLLLVREQSPEDMIVLINSIYSKDNERDIEFLVFQLAKLKVKTVLLYYQNIWKNRFGHEDITQLIVLLTEGQYHNVLKHLLEDFDEIKDKQLEIFAVASVLLMKDNNLIEDVIELFQPIHKNIIKSYLSENGNIDSFTSVDPMFYLQIVEEMLLLGDTEQIDKIVAMAEYFDCDIKDKIGAILIEYSCYSQFFKIYLGKNGSYNPKTVFTAGFCYYKLGLYADALREFEKAILLGWQSNEMYECIEWIVAMSDDQLVTAKAVELKRSRNEICEAAK